MQNFDIIGALAFFTIGAVLVFGVISWIRADKAQKQHKDAAVAQRQRREDGAPPRDERTPEQHSAIAADRVAPTDSGRARNEGRSASPPAAPMLPPD